MKTLFLILLLAPTLSRVKENHDCYLSAKIHPMNYYFSNQTIDFQIEFQSNCMLFDTVNYFMMNYKKDYKLGRDNHPSKVALNIAGRVFDLEFTNRREEGYKMKKKYVYEGVRIKPLIREVNLK